MTKEYNNSLNETFKNFILRTLATVLAILGILFITGVIKVEKVHDVHTAEVYIDGIQVQEKEINLFTGWNISVNMNVNEDAYIGM